MKRILKSTIVILVIVFYGKIIYGPTDYYCYRCAAFSNSPPRAKSSIRSDWIVSIMGKPCVHNWKINSTCMGVADRFVRNDIPLCRASHITFRYALESIPDSELQKQIIILLADENNLLRWLVLESVEKLGMQCLKSDMTDNTWNQWKEKYHLVLSPEYDLDNASQKAGIIKQFLEDDFGQLDISLMSKLEKDLNKKYR